MKKVMLFLFVAILATNCHTQDSKDSKTDISKAKIQQDSLNTPKERWKVNKELDENGNIIRYDSIYSWSSSSGDLNGFSRFDNDSIFKKMQSLMDRHFSMFKSERFHNFSDQDSLMQRFFSDDFFSSGIQSDFPNMNDMIKHMEAMRQQFFNDKNRYIIPPEEGKKKTNAKVKRI